MQLLEIFIRKKYSVCASVLFTAFHMQAPHYLGERNAEAHNSYQKQSVQPLC